VRRAWLLALVVVLVGGVTVGVVAATSGGSRVKPPQAVAPSALGPHWRSVYASRTGDSKDSRAVLLEALVPRTLAALFPWATDTPSTCRNAMHADFGGISSVEFLRANSFTLPIFTEVLAHSSSKPLLTDAIPLDDRYNNAVDRTLGSCPYATRVTCNLVGSGSSGGQAVPNPASGVCKQVFYEGYFSLTCWIAEDGFTARVVYLGPGSHRRESEVESTIIASM
jgi:hypothetical protein